MHFSPSQEDNVHSPLATYVCRLVSCGLLMLVRIIVGPWFMVVAGGECQCQGITVLPLATTTNVARCPD